METKLFNISVEDLDINDTDTKFFIWARKIIENVEYLEENNYEPEDIRKFLQLCADAREKFLDKNDLTETEDFYTEEAQPIFQQYNVIDPIY